MRRRAAFGLLVALALPATASAKLKTETAQAGSVVATVSWNTKGNIGAAADIHLTVFDGDTEIVDAKIPNKMYFTPIQEKFYADKAVGVRDFDGDGTPEVVFDFYTGGAHCCVISYLYDGATLTKQDWGNVGYGLKDYDGDGVPEFDTEDDNFSGLFTFYAASFRPIRVMQFREGAFDDAFTRDASVRPAIVKQRARYLRLSERYAKKVAKDPLYKSVVGQAIGALTADDCLLGDCSPGYALADEALEAGSVRKYFPAALRRKMNKLGYER